MNFPNPFSRGVRADAVSRSRDRSVAAILFVLLALVFAPVIGLHVAMAAFGTDPSVSTGHGRSVPMARPFTGLVHG